MKIVTVRIPEQLYQRVEDIAKELETDISTAIRGLIARGARELETMIKDGKRVIHSFTLPEDIAKDVVIQVIKYEKEGK